ncbi:GH92 family glycosyl hydrolase [Massilia aquatica]|uniref:Glycoside hydrolase family 92 protein n=1 Tax=Massilia aquatica TaxID=2609000 RepID=A0ABX0MJY1_9BURK|nr:GH92 family glycosyl hydrolase [Massilia aquatica]NHZ44715.1 glycoside hydrolase family 92 protein [Massilia aquatica]
MNNTHTIVSTVAMLLAGAAAAGAAEPRFSTSFEAGQPAPATMAAEGVRVEPGDGPERPYAAKPKAGYSGARALRYRAAGKGGRLQLFPVDIAIGRATTLSWKVLPEIVDGDIDSSTGVALDLVLDDGRRISSLDLRDNHGVRADAAAQAQSRTLYPQQWAHKAVRLGQLAGRRIRAIELVLQPTSGAGASGWLDDIEVTQQVRSAATRPSDHVLTTRGTQANGTFSRGNNIPATATPHGFNFWTPATDAGTLNWLYRWNEQNDDDNRPRLQALSLSHQPSPWMGDRQSFQVMPSNAAGQPDADRKRRALSFSHENEVARAHTYRVDFDNGIRAEIAPSERAAIFRFRFPQGGDANLLFDNVDERGGLTFDAGAQTLRGYTDTRSGLSNGAARMFVFARFDQSWQDSGAIATGRPTGYIKFKADKGEVCMRIATSLISLAQAERNLALEIGDAGFDTVRERAQAAWDAELGRVKVEGASDDQLTTVYSNLYRLFLYPNVAHENVGTAQRPDWRHADQSGWSTANTGGDAVRTSAPVVPGKVYVNNGFWDTFRTTWPAYTLFAPTRAGEMVDGFLQQYRDGGWVARWSSPGYADLMVGTSSDVAFADAWLKGVRGFDAHQAYEAALKNATVVPPVSNVGRKGLERSMYRGYADASVHEGMSWTLEGALNDFGLAQMATALAFAEGDSARGRRYREEAAYFKARAADYVHLFDPATGFFRGRDAKGQWREAAGTFDARRWGGDYTEANAWNFAFTVPHDAEGLAGLMGGRAALARRLDTFFATPEAADAKFSGSYGQVIHEMTEARDVRMGMYAHSNQPSHHIPWMYVAAGQPWKTQKITRDIVARLYLGSEIGQGYAGDEDNGEMSAWYTFAMMGLYPLRMGSPEYVIGSPAFARTDVRLENGRLLSVIAHGNSPENVYVQSLKVNGAPWNKAWIRHADIAAGATLEFTMGSKPSAWGSDAGALPASMTSAGQRPAGLRDRSQDAAVTVDGKRVPGPLVDDDAATTVALPAGANVGFTLPNAATIVHYTITGGKAPAGTLSWTLEGRDGSGAWVVLDTREKEPFAWERQLRPFGVSRPGAYREYRLRFAQGTPFELAELELLEAR